VGDGNDWLNNTLEKERSMTMLTRL